MRTIKAMMKRFPLALLLLALLGAPGASLSQTSATRATVPGWREPVRAPHAMVASTSRLASQIGVDVMKRGGNAVDAAIARRACTEVSPGWNWRLRNTAPANSPGDN